MVRARRYRWLDILILLAIADTAVPNIQNKTIQDVNNSLKGVETRRKSKKERSTSSESGMFKSSDSEQSLELTISDSSSSSSSSKRQDKPKSTEERKGWRKWHRKCRACPEDMVKKWRDKSIKWICGGYQRARRSFKSECMMYYRNCQDGTMFVKVHDYRCQNETYNGVLRAHHFHYDYGKDSEDSAKQTESDSSSIHLSSEFNG